MNAIQQAYDKASNYIMGDATHTAKTIINDCYDAIVHTPELADLALRCAFHLNCWNEEETLEEHIADADVIIEEITGTLGEYLDNQ